jgi:uncharacterized membrane protein HdeD (DUF308 family)
MSDPQGQYEPPEAESRRDPYSGEGGPSRPYAVVAARAPSRSWGLLVGTGVVAIVFGILVLANIWGSVRLVAVLAGLFLLFAGVVQLATVAGSHSRGARILSGLVALVAGVALIAWPDASVKTIAVIVGLAFLIWGLAFAFASLFDRRGASGMVVAFGLLLALVGILIMAWPGPTVAILMVLVGLNALIFGIAAVVQGLAMRRLTA